MNEYTSCQASEKEAESENQKQVHSNVTEDSGDLWEDISFFSDLGFFQGHNDIAEPGLLDEQQLLAHVGAMDDLYLDIVSPPFQPCRDDDIRILSSDESQNLQTNEEKSYAFPSASLEILRHCRSRAGTVNGKKIHGLSYEAKNQSPSPSPLSTNHIIELAAGNFIQSKSGTWNELLGLSAENAKDVQLVQDLLSCAEKVHNQQYDCAFKLREEGDKLSLSQANVVQRLVYYFTEALRIKIELETAGKGMENNWPLQSTYINPSLAAFQQKAPPIQVAQFTGIQSVADHVSACTKAHIIDLEIRCGVQLMILMQALALRSECPLEHFKITAVAANSNLMIEAAGVRLRSLAESLNLNFSFHVINLEDILDRKQNLFDLDPEERVVVHAAYAFNHMTRKPNGQLETLMRVITNINPHAMIVSEVEANVNSPVLVNRCVEAVLFYGAFLDCVEDCLKNDVAERTFVEDILIRPAIRNIVAAEGVIVGINVWRAFFSRFGIVETELSKLALDHANLVLNRFDCRDSCTLGLNGKCLVVSWKGTPIFSLSAWKFQGRLTI